MATGADPQRACVASHRHPSNLACFIACRQGRITVLDIELEVPPAPRCVASDFDERALATASLNLRFRPRVFVTMLTSRSVSKTERVAPTLMSLAETMLALAWME
jgi:hypothetical protein